MSQKGHTFPRAGRERERGGSKTKKFGGHSDLRAEAQARRAGGRSQERPVFTAVPDGANPTG